MLFVDDKYYSRAYFDRCYSLFDAHPILGRSTNRRVAVRFADTALWLALCFYAKECGKTVLPLPADAPEEAARRRAERAGCQFLLFGAGEDALRAALPLKVQGDFVESKALPSLIQMSSGTTGAPKVVERSWPDIDTEVEHYARDFKGAEGATPMVAAPVTHSYGLISGVMVALARGEEPRILSNLNPKYVLRKVAEARAPLVYSSPNLIKTLCMLTPAGQRIFSMMTSGTTLQNAWFERIRARVQHLHQQYGCSEAGCITVAEDIDAATDLGVPLSHLGLTTSEDAQQPSPIVVEFKNGSTVDTGDLGYLEGGRLRFFSRRDDMINVAGLNVYPLEVEEVVLEMPEILDAVVFGKTTTSGQKEVALQFVSEREVSAAAIRTWCSERLLRHQVPMNVTQVSTIQRLLNGKVSRKALAEA